MTAVGFPVCQMFLSHVLESSTALLVQATGEQRAAAEAAAERANASAAKERTWSLDRVVWE